MARAQAIIAIGAALVVARVCPALVCGAQADAWLDDDRNARRLARDLIAFEAADNRARGEPTPANRFEGEWALVTHQMIAIGLAQLCLADRASCGAYAKTATTAAAKSFRPEMRDFGTRAWEGEDVLSSLDSSHGHAYMAYPALAVGMARLVDRDFPADLAAEHDALIAAYERRLLASTTGLIETYPGEAYPTDVSAVAAAIAVHGRATGKNHDAVLRHWVERVGAVQIDPSGFVIQRMGAEDGVRHDAPRGSGTGLAAYYAGFVDRALAARLTDALLRHESTFWGFGAIREYAAGSSGAGDVDSGPVVLGVSVAATGFALAAFRAHGHRDAFTRVFRTTTLFGNPTRVDDDGWPSKRGDRVRFTTGGPIGNALLLAMLTSGPEIPR